MPCFCCSHTAFQEFNFVVMLSPPQAANQCSQSCWTANCAVLQELFIRRFGGKLPFGVFGNISRHELGDSFRLNQPVASRPHGSHFVQSCAQSIITIRNGLLVRIPRNPPLPDPRRTQTWRTVAQNCRPAGVLDRRVSGAAESSDLLKSSAD